MVLVVEITAAMTRFLLSVRSLEVGGRMQRRINARNNIHCAERTDTSP